MVIWLECVFKMTSASQTQQNLKDILILSIVFSKSFVNILLKTNEQIWEIVCS